MKIYFNFKPKLELINRPLVILKTLAICWNSNKNN